MIGNGALLQRMLKVSQARRGAIKDLKTVRQSPIDPRDGVVLCNVKDEIDRLPHFLRHYRAIGAKRFVFVDNGSTDQSSRYLADQGDCDVYHCRACGRIVRGSASRMPLL